MKYVINGILLSIMILSCSDENQKELDLTVKTSGNKKTQIKEAYFSDLNDASYLRDFSLKKALLKDSVIYLITVYGEEYIIKIEDTITKLYEVFPKNTLFNEYILTDEKIIGIEISHDTIKGFDMRSKKLLFMIDNFNISFDTFDFDAKGNIWYLNKENQLLTNIFPYTKQPLILYQFDKFLEISDIKKLSDSVFIYFKNAYELNSDFADHTKEVNNIPYILNLKTKKNYELKRKTEGLFEISNIIDTNLVLIQTHYAVYNSYHVLYKVTSDSLVFQKQFSELSHYGKVKLVKYKNEIIELIIKDDAIYLHKHKK
jgi:hypothetical protein